MYNSGEVINMDILLEIGRIIITSIIAGVFCFYIVGFAISLLNPHGRMNKIKTEKVILYKIGRAHV